MNYTDLTTNIADITESSFTADQLAMFVQQAEQKIYATVQLPALQANSSGTTTSDNEYLGIPTGMMDVISIAVVNGGSYEYLINKDASFIREAYPDSTATGTPKHYAIFDDDSFLLGPTPDAAYSVKVQYSKYPESIVTAGTTWLGDEFDSALLNGALLEAIRFMKGEPDIIATYEKMYLQSIALLQNIGNGKLQQDTYRSGKYKSVVS